MANEATPSGSDPWPESARRYVKALKQALRICRAERAHYVSIVEEHEYDWFMAEDLQGQIEGLSIRNYELEIVCEKLKARIAEMQSDRPRIARSADDSESISPVHRSAPYTSGTPGAPGAPYHEHQPTA